MKGNHEHEEPSARAKSSHLTAPPHPFMLIQARGRTRRALGNPRRLSQLVLETIGIATLFLVIAGFFLNALPKLSVGPSESKANDPTRSVFYLSNDGKLSIYNVSFACALNNLGEIVDNVVIDLGRQNAAVLRPGARLALSCPDAVQVNTLSAQRNATVTLLVIYRPAWVPWSRRVSFAMAAENTAPGVWTWKSVP